MASPRELARNQALGRIVFGTALLVAPEQLTRGWLGSRDARRTATKVVGVALGARDLGLGLGTARAVGAGFGARPWIARRRPRRRRRPDRDAPRPRRPAGVRRGDVGALAGGVGRARSLAARARSTERLQRR